MAENNDFKVDGYVFGTQEDADLAKSEKTKIERIEEKINYNDSSMVNAVLKKALENRTFKTPIGYEYLRKLQKIAHNNPPVDEEIPDIPFYGTFNLRGSTSPATQKVTPSIKIPPKQKKDIIGKRASLILNLVLVALVCALFIITMKGSTPNILNYEKALQNRYAEWNQELSDREEAIREKEKELLINE
jgi:hypothetical protein